MQTLFSFLRPLKALVVAICLLINGVSYAEEVDDFLRDPNKIPADSVDAINLMINGHFKQFEEKYAQGNLSCDREELVKNLLYFFDRNFSKVGNELRDRKMSDSGITYRNVARKDLKLFDDVNSKSNRPDNGYPSIYRGTEVYCCAASVNVSGQLIGVDKIDHFFGNGGMLWGEYEKAKVKDEKNILKLNMNQENGGWGLAGEGIKSYGDLAANWDGFKFYKELIDGPNPFLSCADGKIKILRKFDLGSYVKLSWRESANCSAYSSKEMAVRMTNNIKKQNLTCPEMKEDCSKIMNLYKADQSVMAGIVSPVCLKNIKPEESVEAEGGFDWTALKAAAGGVRFKDIEKLIKKGAR